MNPCTNIITNLKTIQVPLKVSKNTTRTPWKNMTLQYPSLDLKSTMPMVRLQFSQAK